ncbi:RRM domain-containing protein [Cryptosporidium muris RN66]|uniref:RRM domain-containing protein n=1 Tax=Cryptosporidium muris (strain RN66) TaxID=441375 RepID=B6AGR5_CRYMR|nr:RRM domain-containing protein [Cryptosporidium muris RN66]EEA07406.1 RRM domain-containing protein [Cryptosporidium muris RN66]|eukprot:XP_002141755.1 RRM domain-containing protein [Cryptosporidium muris RN66]
MAEHVRLRKAAGQVWVDNTLNEWPENDYRLFCGDLGNDITEEVLANNFQIYPSFQKCKVIRDKYTNKSRGYGFISFGDPQDMLRALKEMNRKYIGSRPITLKRSRWKDREIDSEKNKKFDILMNKQGVNNPLNTVRIFKKRRYKHTTDKDKK